MDPKPSVVQLCLSPSWGGLEMSAIKHALWFKDAGYPVSGVCLIGSPLEKAFKDHHFPVLSLNARGYFSLKDSLKLRKFLKRHKAHTVFCHHLKDLWRLRLSLIGLPNIQVIGFARMFLRNVNKKDFLHRWVYGRMRTLVSLTEVQKEALLKCLPVRPENMKVIPDGVNVDQFHPNQRNDGFRGEVFHVSPDEKAVGLVGRLDPQKGSREFVEAAAQVLEKVPHTKFFLIGKETPDTPGFEAGLKAEVSSKNLSERIFFLGHRTDVDRVIANLDIFCMPSYEETFGDVLIEAMSCQVPVIATRAGGPINIVDDEENGLLIPAKEVTPLAKAITKLLKDPGLSQRLAHHGRKKALAVYDERAIFRQLEELVQFSPKEIRPALSNSRISSADNSRRL